MTDGGLQEVQFVLKAIKLKCDTIPKDHEPSNATGEGADASWRQKSLAEILRKRMASHLEMCVLISSYNVPH